MELNPVFRWSSSETLAGQRSPVVLGSLGKQGVPQEGVISPLISNVYLNEVDQMLEKAIEVTRYGKQKQFTVVQYARFADAMVILIHAHSWNDWLLGTVEKRLREELVKLQVEINEEKSRTVDLSEGESFTFLGFEFRPVLGGSGTWRPLFVPKLKKRMALTQKLKVIFRKYISAPVGRVVERINPILRGWVNYFAGRELEPMFLVGEELGRKEDPAPSDAGSEA